MKSTVAIRQGTKIVLDVILGLSCLFGQTQKDQKQQIAAALQNHQFDRALDLLNPPLRSSPEDAELWTMQGVAYAGRGQKKEALASFRNAISLSPNDIPALHGAIQIEYDAGNSDAIPLLQHLLRLQPSDLTSHAMLAVLEYQRGNCSLAVVHFQKAASLFDQQLPALNAYATCLVRLRRPADAGDVFQRALALNPDNPRERQLLACLQVMAKKPEDAILTLGPLLSDNHADSTTLELASSAYEDAHETEKAVDALRQAILIDPQNVQLYLDFAALSATHQSFQVGINVVNDGIGLQPKAAALYFARGVLYVQIAEYERAQADFAKAYELDPSQSLSAAAQSLAAVQQNNLDQALSDVQEKLTRRPKDPILLYIQADVLVQKGAEPGSPEFQTAMHSAKSAVTLRPSLGPAHQVLGKLYLQAGEYSEAAVQCRRALEIDPNDQTSLYHLIQALRKGDKKSEIPDLLKRLAGLRQEATKEEREQYRYKLVEGDAGK